MQLFITILHVMLSISLILIILLQPGKEGAAVLGGGGGGNQMYGPRGQANFLGRATTVVAAMFMVTSITLAYRSSERTQAGTDNLEDVMKELDEEAATAADPTPAPPAQPQVVPAPSPDPVGAAPEAPAEGAPAAPAEDTNPTGENAGGDNIDDQTAPPSDDPGVE